MKGKSEVLLSFQNMNVKNKSLSMSPTDWEALIRMQRNQSAMVPFLTAAVFLSLKPK